MIPKHKYSAALLALILGAGLAPAHDLKWFTIDGGGGSCSDGRYALSGTVGQPDAGVLAGADHTLTGGFWAGSDEASRPALRILRNGISVILAWPTTAIGFRVQETASLSAPNWRDVNQTPLVVGQENWVVMSATANAEFFRLRKP